MENFEWSFHFKQSRKNISSKNRFKYQVSNFIFWFNNYFKINKTILFSPMDAHGLMNSFIRVGQVLLARGHRVVFAVDATWKDKLVKYGFEEELIYISDNINE